jgi:hypothetical protein
MRSRSILRENECIVMLAIILCVFRFVRLLGSGHQAVAIENLALRLQLAAYKRKRKRPVLTQLDRLFWIGLSQVWSGWRRALLLFSPTRWSVGNGSDSADSGRDSPGRIVLVEEDRPLPATSAD